MRSAFHSPNNALLNGTKLLNAPSEQLTKKTKGTPAGAKEQGEPTEALAGGSPNRRTGRTCKRTSEMGQDLKSECEGTPVVDEDPVNGSERTSDVT